MYIKTYSVCWREQGPSVCIMMWYLAGTHFVGTSVGAGDHRFTVMMVIDSWLINVKQKSFFVFAE